jgi:hypothetical protein
LSGVLEDQPALHHNLVEGMATLDFMEKCHAGQAVYGSPGRHYQGEAHTMHHGYRSSYTV